MKINFPKLLGVANELETQTNDFLELVCDISNSSEQAIISYFFDFDESQFNQLIEKVCLAEKKADELCHVIESRLYIQTLIPDLRGDVLKLLDDILLVATKYCDLLWYIKLEKAEVMDDFKPLYKDLTHSTTQCIQALIDGAKAFFNDTKAVKLNLDKVMFFEDEVDHLSHELKRAIFQKEELDLAEKIHLRFFVERTEWISDLAEDIADSITIYTIKRAL